jgi:hypothetical protein
MHDAYQTFKKFNQKEIAEDFADVLEKAGIKFLIEEDSLQFDASFANNPLNRDFLVKIKQEDFEKASRAYEVYFSEHLNEIDRDYYLFQFSDDELKEIVSKPDEWGSFDFQLAQELLKQRGIEITDTEKQAIKTERFREISKPQSVTNSHIILDYVTCIFSFPACIYFGTTIPLYLFGASVIIAWVWGFSKKTLPNGDRVFSYSTHARKNGRIIFYLGMTIFMITTLILIFLPFR